MAESARHKCNAPTIWEEVGPSSVHAYRVTCTLCRKLIKWGTADQLAEAQSGGKISKVIPFRSAATLERFFTDNRSDFGKKAASSE